MLSAVDTLLISEKSDRFDLEKIYHLSIPDVLIDIEFLEILQRNLKVNFCSPQEGSYEKEGILQNTVSRVLQKVPILGQQLHQIRDSSCSICAKQALERCPFEIMKVKPNGTEPRVSFEEIHRVLQPGPHRFMGLMRNIVSTMHVQSKIDLDRAKQREAKYKLKNVGDKVDKVIDTLTEIIRKR